MMADKIQLFAEFATLKEEREMREATMKTYKPRAIALHQQYQICTFRNAHIQQCVNPSQPQYKPCICVQKFPIIRMSAEHMHCSY